MWGGVYDGVFFGTHGGRVFATLEDDGVIKLHQPFSAQTNVTIGGRISVGSSEDFDLGVCRFSGRLSFNGKRVSGTGAWRCFPEDKEDKEPAGQWFASCTALCWEPPRIGRAVR